MAKAAPKKHYHIEFATRHAKNSIRSLRAFSALSRAESLVEDINSFIALKKECEEKGIAFGRFIYTYEIINYYAVGFITCLEWHVRSRVVDLLTYDPSRITKDDVKAAREEALSQMMMEEVTVPLLVGASIRVANTAAYVRELQRVFDGLNIKATAEKVLRDCEFHESRWGQRIKKSLHDIIDELFEIRHTLVHEIGWGVIGHFSVRDLWELERPKQFGAAVIKCIQLLEAEITKHASQDFPNRLDASFVPEDDLGKLQSQIAALEKKLEAHYAKVSHLADPKHSPVAIWKDAEVANAAAIKADLDVIDHSVFLRPVRHLDYRPEMEMDLLRSRFRYLTALADASDWYEFDSTGDEEKKS
ncbi:hypothetical protein [Hyphomicrobium sp.]|uniref:hypothetical protein n=1 Tax=Hyphomicrobium sp. TaxID=82 RepID=UPI001DA939A5|nr:hypothetical protein [Hyphomicrobium sp.]MBY0559327.1 hypothetical protein [Hyphomicrobium sp.]